MTDSPTPSDIEQLPQAWCNLWRAHTVLPDSVASDELTIFVRAGGRDAALLAVKRALHAIFPAGHQGLDETYENLSSAPELVREGRAQGLRRRALLPRLQAIYETLCPDDVLHTEDPRRPVILEEMRLVVQAPTDTQAAEVVDRWNSWPNP